MSSVNGQVDTSLAQRTRLAVFWNTGITTLISIGQFGVMLMMVRLLSPEVYGQYGLLMAIIGFLYVFSAQNYVDFVLQVRQEVDVHYQDIFTISVGINAILFVATNVIAVAARAFPEYENVATPLHVLSFGFLLQPGRAVRIAMLKRALDWKRIRMLHGVGFLLSASVAIPLAWWGAGIYALLAPTFIVPLPFLYDIFFRRGWRPDWTWSLERLKPAISFGVNRQVSGLIVAGRRLLESGVMVQVLGFASFGIYGRAVGLAELACNRALSHAIEAMYPSLTKIEPDTARFRRVAGLVLRTSAWFVIPIAVLMAELADILVRLVYGQKWLDVIPLVGWTMALAASGAVYYTLYKLLLAHGQQRHCLWTDVCSIAGTVLALYFLLPHGLTSYIQGLVAVQVAMTALSASFLVVNRGLDTGGVAKALGAPVVGTFFAMLVFAGHEVGPVGGARETLMVGFQIVLYAVLYVAVLRLAFPRSLRELVSYLPGHELLNRVLFLGVSPQAREASGH